MNIQCILENLWKDYSTVLQKYKQWKLQRLWHKHGCKNQLQYERLIDPDINRRSNTIPEFYVGYPYVHRYVMYDENYHYQIEIVNEWCKQYCKGKWRYDWHRVHTEWSIKGNIIFVYDNFDEFTGIDFFFVAFQSEKDYNWFILKWGSHD